ncbi:hypothetical protein ACR3GG_000070 [Shigella sonnei]
MSELLPKIDVSHLGEPSEERKALDWLGYFDERVVLRSVMKGKAKHFRIRYIRKGFGHVTIDYIEKAGSISTEMIYKAKE